MSSLNRADNNVVVNISNIDWSISNLLSMPTILSKLSFHDAFVLDEHNDFKSSNTVSFLFRLNPSVDQIGVEPTSIISRWPIAAVRFNDVKIFDKTNINGLTALIVGITHVNTEEISESIYKTFFNDHIGGCAIVSHSKEVNVIIYESNGTLLKVFT